jgi:TolB-like protein
MNWIPMPFINARGDSHYGNALRADLARLERSRPLAGSPKLLQLLRYLFAETLDGRGEQISQYSIAFDCYQLGDQFETTTNTIVRSHARRLRRILKELTLEKGSARILMRERGYQLKLEMAADAPPGGARPDSIRVPTLGILEFEVTHGAEIPHRLPKALATELMVELANTHGVEPIGPFSRAMLPASHAPVWEFARSQNFDMLFDGTFFVEGNQCTIHPRILDGKSGRQLWAVRHRVPSADWSPASIRALARTLAVKVAGDWGVVSQQITRGARSRGVEPLQLHEAVMLGRQYLTNFHYEHLAPCVATLRQAANETEEAAIPATLAVLLNTAGSVEPRWHETIDRDEIRHLAARAARLDPEDPWSRLALAVSSLLDRRFEVLRETAKRADQEHGTPLMLVGALGSMLCFQGLEVELGRRMLDRYCRNSPHYPRFVHLALALAAVGENDLATARAELARFDVPWGWAFPLVTAACAAIEGDADTARSEWQRVLAAYPDFPGRWRETLATQWGDGHLLRIFSALESAGVPTGCL